MEKLAAMRQFFKSMVTYKIASIISTLNSLQIKLLQKADDLQPEEMDIELNKLETMRRVVDISTLPPDKSK